MQDKQIKRRSFVQQKVVLFCSIIFILCGSIVSYAQSNSATLRGTVSDENDAALPRVEITITNNENQSKRTIHTNASGFYTAPGLSPGTYRITTQADGFAPKEVEDIVLNTSDQRRLDIQLKVKGTSASVIVTENAINEDSAIATTFDQTFVQNIPLNGRTLQSLLFMTPGVVVTGANGEISVNGQRTNENYYTIDGVSANIGVGINPSDPRFANFISGSQLGTNIFGGTNSLVSIEELEEIKVQTSNYSAAFGRMTGAQVQLTTKSGGNQFRGSLYEYFRNEILDANDWTLNKNSMDRPPLRLNNFGGTFSGPLSIPSMGLGNRHFINGKDRTFFFVNIEGMKMLLPQPVIDVPTPLPEYRNKITNPKLKALLDALPLPTKPAPDYWTGTGVSKTRGFYPSFSSNFSKMEKYSIKIDHNITTNHSIWGRYNYSPSYQADYLGLNETNRWRKVNATTVGYRAVITPVIFNEVNFNYSTNSGRWNNLVVPNGGGVPFDLRTLAPNAPERSLIRINLPIELYMSAFMQGDSVDNQQKQFNLTDNFSWIIANHSLKLGADFRRMAPRYAQQDYDLNYVISSLTHLENSQYRSLNVTTRNAVNVHYDNISSYASDSWRVNNRFGLDLGIRWDINPAPRGTNVHLYTVTGFPDIKNLSLAPGGAPLYPTRYDGFSPTFGFSYLLRRDTGLETVLRGGYRLGQSLGAGVIANAAQSYPHFGSKIYGPGKFPAEGELIEPALLPNLAPPYNGAQFSLAARNLSLPRTHSWSLAIQQSFGKSDSISVSYVGNKSRRLLKRYLISVPSTELSATPSKPYNSNFPGALLYITRNDPGYGDSSDYNSMQVTYDRRLSRGLQVMANYTLAHAISTGDVDDGSEGLGIGITPTLARIDSSFDRRHVFGSLISYHLPTIKSNRGGFRWVNKIALNGWSIAGSYRYQSGTPMTIFYSVQNPVNPSQRLTFRADRVLDEPVLINDPLAPGGRMLNSKAFAPTAEAMSRFDSSFKYQGNLNANVARNVGIYQLDFSLRRMFSLGERLKLNFNCDVFNILNHPTFGSPNTNIGTVSYINTPGGQHAQFSPNSQFGISTNTLARSSTAGGLSPLFTIGGPRSIQLSMKLEF